MKVSTRILTERDDKKFPVVTLKTGKDYKVQFAIVLCIGTRPKH